jgi:hypothetical protein
LASYALLVAPFGCEFQADLIGDDLNTQSAGLFLNPDTSDPLIVAGRNAAGDSFFVYGTRQSNGAIGEVDSILIRTAAGQESVIAFQLGRPVYVEAPNSSFVRITYTEVSAQRLTATVEVHDAASGGTETVEADVDLQKTAAQVAQAVENLTGVSVVLPEVPLGGTGKWQQRAINPLLLTLAVVPMIAMSELLVVVMGQVMQVVYAAVSAALKGAVALIFAPVFLFSALLSEVTVQVESVPLLDVFIELPPAPVIDIIID